MKVLPVVSFLVLFGCHCAQLHTDRDDSSEKHVKKKVAIRKRQIYCPHDEYQAGEHCCQNCEEGTHVKTDCTKEHENAICSPCTEGLDYMDKRNGYTHCIKCYTCDSGLGQEILKNCTVTENAQCKCKEGFFCKETNPSSTEECLSCEHCTECEYGVITQCTAITDNVCSQEHRSRKGLYIVFLLVFIGAVILFACTCCRRNMESPVQNPNQESPVQNPNQPLIVPDHLKDIDLTPHLTSIAGKLNLPDLMTCVREMNLPEQTIVDIQYDYKPLGANEIKYQLLKKWYESWGQKGAFQSLITTLENNNYKVSAQQVVQLVSEQLSNGADGVE